MKLKKTLAVLLVFTNSSCSLLNGKETTIVAPASEIPIVQPVLPRSLDLTEPHFFVVTPENYEEVMKQVERISGHKVLIAISVPDYEVMIENTQEFKRYINQLGQAVIYYRTVTD